MANEGELKHIKSHMLACSLPERKIRIGRIEEELCHE